MTRALTIVSLVIVLLLGWVGLTQGSAFQLRSEEPTLYWPRSNGVIVRSYVRGRGVVIRSGRSQFEGFPGGGPGGAK